MGKNTGEAKRVTIADLVKESGQDARKIRATIRALGMKAPVIENQEGFGPKSKYDWAGNDPNLAKIREALKNGVPKAPKPEPVAAGKTSGKPAAKTEDPSDDDDD